MPNYVFIQNDHLQSSTRPPTGHLPFTHAQDILRPTLVEPLHRSFRAWGVAGFSPGELAPEYVLVSAEGGLAILYDGKRRPAPLMQLTGAAPDLAAWLVLLDKSLATDAVLAPATGVWTRTELATALPFMTPAFLPDGLVRYPPVNWVRVARCAGSRGRSNRLNAILSQRVTHGLRRITCHRVHTGPRRTCEGRTAVCARRRSPLRSSRRGRSAARTTLRAVWRSGLGPPVTRQH